MLVVLALTTGATDATAFERLGHVFASVITGNLILLGVSAVKVDGHLALFSACALCGYACGVLLAAPRPGAGESGAQPVWPRSATRALAIDLALLVAFGVAWELGGAHPGRGLEVALLVTAAAAMGVQSTAVRRLGQMSTTYLTSTLTGLLEAMVTRRWTGEHLRSVGILAAAVVGAAAATAAVRYARGALPALQLVPLAAVLAVSWRRLASPADE